MFNILDIVAPPGGGAGIFAAIAAAIAAVGIFFKNLFSKKNRKK